METVMRLIDADALFEALGLDQHNNGEGMTSDEEWVAEAITTAPTIEAEPVRRGRWEAIDWANEYFKCSGCGRIERWSPNYCPNCGIKMANRTRYVGTSKIIEEPNCGAKMEE